MIRLKIMLIFRISSKITQENTLASNQKLWNNKIIRISQIILIYQVISMSRYLPLIALALLIHIAEPSDSYFPNPYFDSICTGRATFSAQPSQTSLTTAFSAAYFNSFANSALVQCYVALSSIHIPFNHFLENKVEVLGCTATEISIALLANPKNINIVSYIVLSGSLIGSQNLIALSLKIQSTNFAQNSPTVKSQPINGVNATGKIKQFSFFQGFSLRINNAGLSQTVSLQRGFSLIVNHINSAVVNYSILTHGRNKYQGSITILVILYNSDFFNPPGTIRFAGSTEEYTGLVDATIPIDLSYYQQKLSIFTGLNKLYAYGDLTFNLSMGHQSVHSNGGTNSFCISYIAVPESIVQTPHLAKQVASRQLAGNQSTNSSLSGQQSSSGFSGQSMIVIVVTVVCCILLLGIVLVILYCCWRQQKKQPQRQDSLSKPSIQPQVSLVQKSTTLILSPINIEYLHNQLCKICIDKQIQLMTHCQHYLHIKCLKYKRKRVQNCPECEDLLIGRKITVFCRKCWKGYVMGLEQSVKLDADTGLDQICKELHDIDPYQHDIDPYQIEMIDGVIDIN